MRRGLKHYTTPPPSASAIAARAAPYEKGSEEGSRLAQRSTAAVPRARPPMRRGLKLCLRGLCRPAPAAARAAPYEKGTETLDEYFGGRSAHRAARAAPYEKGTET